MNQNNLTNLLTYFQSSSDEKIQILTEMVFSLLVEVEVLRKLSLENSKYASLYKETALTSHNSSGAISGMEKILQQWFGEHGIIQNNFSSGQARESVMLQRLGFSKDDINKFFEECKKLESLT